MTLTALEASEGARGWRLLLGRLHLTVDCGGFDEALEFIERVAEIANDQNHHPDIDLRYNRVHLAVVSHDAGGLTDRDVRLAEAICVIVDELDLKPERASLTEVEIAIDTLDAGAIRPFWAAVLGYEDDGDEVHDPQGRGPTVWFQQLSSENPVRNRIHLDVTVAHDEAEERIEAVLAAGGRLVSGDRAPAFWILADADGNEACVCTWQGREED